MFQKFLADGGTNAAGIQGEPFAIKFFHSIKSAGERPAFEAADGAIFAIDSIHSFMADRRFEIAEHYRSVRKRMREPVRQFSEFSENRQQFSQGVRSRAEWP